MAVLKKDVEELKNLLAQLDQKKGGREGLEIAREIEKKVKALPKK